MSAVEEITNKYKKAGWSIEWFDFIDETRRQSLFHDGTYALATKTINGNTYGVAYYTEGRVSASLTDAQGRKLIKANGEDNRKKLYAYIHDDAELQEAYDNDRIDIQSGNQNRVDFSVNGLRIYKSRPRNDDILYAILPADELDKLMPLYDKHVILNQKKMDEEFVEETFKEFEREGHSQTFHASGDDYAQYDGQPYTILGRIPASENENIWDGLPMWKIQFKDGNRTGVFPDEIIPSVIMENHPQLDKNAIHAQPFTVEEKQFYVEEEKKLAQKASSLEQAISDYVDFAKASGHATEQAMREVKAIMKKALHQQKKKASQQVADR